GQDAAPATRECTFAGFMKCNPTAFREGKKVRFVVLMLQGPALTWWNAKIANIGLETVNRMPWIEMKQLMTAEFCPIKEIQRTEHELWNLKCTIKCHKCRKVGYKLRYCKEKNVSTSANALLILTCYDCGEQGHTRNRCLRKVKQEEVAEVHGRAYAIKEFVDTRFSSMLNIDPVKIGASYEVELQTPLGCTLNLVNHIFKIDLMPIELGTFDIIIGMD
nr:hypothetical protein [Tanacetum cinerariifolium]